MKNDIDLSKVKIGQKLRLRNGRIVTFDGYGNNLNYPFHVKENANIYMKNGRYFESGKSPSDIIEILPETSPNAVSKRRKGGAKVEGA